MSVETIFEPLVRRKLFASPEEAARKLVRHYVLRGITSVSSLPALLNLVVTTLQTCSYCTSVAVVETKEFSKSFQPDPIDKGYD